jgi:hypothetical protein
MYNIKLKDTQAILTIESINIKNFYAFINCSIKSPDTQVNPKGFLIYYKYNSVIKPINANRYWVDNAPDIDSGLSEISTNKNLNFVLKINLFGGELIDLNLTKKIELIIYQTQQIDASNKVLVWNSPEINLISKKIPTPITLYTLATKNKVVTVNIKHNWFSDYDFNYFSDDFKVRVSLKHMDNNPKAIQIFFINKTEQEFIFENIDTGYYFVEVEVILFNGYVVYKNREDVYIETENVKGYIKFEGKIYIIDKAFIKDLNEVEKTYAMLNTIKDTVL